MVERILKNNEQALVERASTLNTILGDRLTVLPPDTRHVDYDVIGLVIADGCLYQCKFCCVKSGRPFKERSIEAIREQIRQLGTYYGRNIVNYNALFLGNHDALAADGSLVLQAAGGAHETFFKRHPRADAPKLYLFGSVDSILNAKGSVFEQLNALPYQTHINIGFESLDPSTLATIGKSIPASKMLDAFQAMLDINAAYPDIEVTGNFLMGEGLPNAHYESIIELLEATPPPAQGKGAIYMSPLQNSPKKRELLPQFLEMKNRSRMPTYIYLIQRL